MKRRSRVPLTWDRRRLPWERGRPRLHAINDAGEARFRHLYPLHIPVTGERRRPRLRLKKMKYPALAGNNINEEVVY